MSRLDSFIRRLEAQRSCLNLAVELVSTLEGPVFELGLGNGRTFDHLREAMPEREIFVFERKVAAHPDCIPDNAHLFEGPIEETLPRELTRFKGQVALIHADLGSGRPEVDALTSAFLSRECPAFLAAGGVILSDQPLQIEGAQSPALPSGVASGRYHFFRIG